VFDSNGEFRTGAGWTHTRLALLLSLAAGYVDAYAFLKYSVYSSFMSGNTTQTGLQFGQAKFARAALDLLPIPSFALGVFGGILLVGRQRLRFGVVGALLVASAASAGFSATQSPLNIALLSLAMGLMNTLITRVGAQTVHLGFVTGTLYSLSEHLALAVARAPDPHILGIWDTHRWRAARLAWIWMAFLFGALLGTTATSFLDVWTPVLPASVLVAATFGSNGK
jgi:uncharacterized membrane protein YoaK (UPF0700 family)